MNGAIAQGRGDRRREPGRLLHAAAVQEPGQPGDPSQRPPGRRSGTTPTGKVDILVSGVGTGGTITGVSRYIKQRKPKFMSIAVEPVNSPVITQTLAGRAAQAGAAQDPGHRRRLSRTCSTCRWSTGRAVQRLTYARRLAREEGILSGISCGAAVAAAVRLAAPRGRARPSSWSCPIRATLSAR